MEADPKFTSREVLQSMRIIHFALLFSSAGFLVISLIVVSIYGPLGKMEKSNSQLFLSAGLFIGAALVALAYYLHSRQLKNNIRAPFILRFKNYRNSFLTKIMLLEAASLFVMVVYLLTAIVSMLAGSAIIIILLLLNRPGVNNAISELNLSENEISTLE